jgi:hypothetical protein
MRTLILLLFLSLTGIGYSQTGSSGVEIHWELDVSDLKLFEECRDDIQSNFALFMQESGFGDVKPGQTLTMYWSKIAGLGTLQSASASITGPSDKLAYQVQRKQLNPGKLLQLKNTQLTEFQKTAQTGIAKSSIIEVLIKDLLQGDATKQCYFFVFSDMVENSGIVNCYKSIPATKAQIKKTIERIDPYLKTKLDKKIEAGFSPIVVLVQKDSRGKVDSQAIRKFWIDLLSILNITNVKLIDNLSNNINR